MASQAERRRLKKEQWEGAAGGERENCFGENEMGTEDSVSAHAVSAT